MDKPPALHNFRTLTFKTHPISEDYVISEKILGQGINGSVVQVHDKKTVTVYALKVRFSARSLSLGKFKPLDRL